MKKHKREASTGEKRGVRIGIRGKLMTAMVGSLLIVLSITGIMLQMQTSTNVSRLKAADITSQARAIRMETEGYFNSFFNAQAVVADMDNIALLMNEVNAAGINFSEAAGLEAAKRELKNAFVNLPDGAQGLFIASSAIDGVVLNDGTVLDKLGVTARPWWQLLVTNNGAPSVTGAYTDVSTGQLVVTTVVPVYSGQQMVGAVGVDVSLDSLITRLKQTTIGETGFAVVFDGDHNIVFHPDETVLLQNIDETTYSQNIKDSVDQGKDLLGVTYQRGDNVFHGSTMHMPSLGWQVLGCMPEAEFNQEVSFFTTMIITAFLLAGVLLCVVTLISITTVVRPIKRLDQVANRLAEGDLDVEVNVHTKDEVGKLAHSISMIVDRLKTYIDYIDELAAVLEGMGRRNLIFTLKQDYVGEFAKLKAAMLDIQSSLSGTMFRMLDSAEQVDSSSEQMAMASQSLAQGATEQASSVQELAATVQELSRHSVEQASKAVTTSQEVAQVGDKLKESNQQMQNMVKAMNNISTQSSEIGKIVKTVEDIAFQTNILALNAAVEAARAGEAGKGFAVVADEVRNLASKSGEAAKNITQLIQDTIIAVNDGVQIADVTATSLDEVAQHVAEVVGAIDQISAKYQDQAGELGQVATGIDQISAVVQTNSATAEESAASAEELAGQVELMKGMVEAFKLDEKFHHQ